MAADTKRVIAEKLFELLDSERFNEITVKRLADECGISRQTFYYHFNDIMDVLEWGCEQALEENLDKSLQKTAPREALKVFVSEVVRRRSAIRHMLSGARAGEFVVVFNRISKDMLRELMRRRYPNSSLSAADSEAMLDFCTAGIMGMLLTHYTDRGLDIDAFVERVYRLLSGQVLAELSASPAPKY